MRHAPALFALLGASCAGAAFRAEPFAPPRDGVLLDVPVVKQEALHECGLASVGALLAYHGVSFPQEERARLAELARAEGGLSGEELESALERLGFRAFLFHGTLDGGPESGAAGVLRYVDARTPPLVLLDARPDAPGHYALLTGYDAGGAFVYLFDPARGHARLERAAFLDRWSKTGFFTLLALPPALAAARR